MPVCLAECLVKWIFWLNTALHISQRNEADFDADFFRFSSAFVKELAYKIKNKNVKIYILF